MTTIEQYRAHPGINATALKAGLKSMLHMRHAITKGFDQSGAMKFGSMVHQFTLDAPDFVVYPAIRRGKEWDAFQAANAEKTIIIESEREKLLSDWGIVQAVKNAIGGIDLSAMIEQPIYWEEPRLGQCKALPDYYHEGRLVDLKTTADIEERAFSNSSWKMGYHIQMAWYRRGLRANGLPVEQVEILAVESAGPFDSVICPVDEGLLEYGEKEAVRIATEYRAAEKAGRFPGRYSHPVTLLQPAWADEQVQGLPDEELDPSDI